MDSENERERLARHVNDITYEVVATAVVLSMLFVIWAGVGLVLLFALQGAAGLAATAGIAWTVYALFGLSGRLDRWWRREFPRGGPASRR